MAGVTGNHKADETTHYYVIKFDAPKEEIDKLLSQLLIKSKAMLYRALCSS